MITTTNVNAQNIGDTKYDPSMANHLRRVDTTNAIATVQGYDVSGASNGSVPSTGDETDFTPWIVLIIVAAVALGGVLFLRMRSGKKDKDKNDKEKG